MSECCGITSETVYILSTSPTGDPGYNGITGFTGPTGAPGAPGAEYHTGMTGPTGRPGTGTSSITGPQGPAFNLNIQEAFVPLTGLIAVINNGVGIGFYNTYYTVAVQVLGIQTVLSTAIYYNGVTYFNNSFQTPSQGGNPIGTWDGAAIVTIEFEQGAALFYLNFPIDLRNVAYFYNNVFLDTATETNGDEAMAQPVPPNTVGIAQDTYLLVYYIPT